MNVFRVAMALVIVNAILVSMAVADERILDYHSDITINRDGSMIVDESITVRAEGRRIVRGIYRDFPTDYRDEFGNQYVVEFDVLGVRRDGIAENWHTEDRSNGVRVYVGDANRTLKPGDYVYTIRYRTNRQLGFFKDHDELYWNVTGNGWAFAIDQVSAIVKLPGRPSADQLTMEGYTGRYLSQGRDYEGWTDQAQAGIRSTRTLAPEEGLSLVVSFPKGLVAEPTAADRLGYLLADNRGLLLALLAIVGSFVYLSITWHRLGRDPDSGVIFAHYEPPEGYSPASARYISRMSYDAGVFSAAVINLAVKGHVSIDKSGKKYSLKHLRSDTVLAPGEAALKDKLFRTGVELELDNENHEIVSAARKAHRRALRRDYLNVYFRKNGVMLLPSLLGSLAVLVVAALLGALVPAAIAIFAFNGLMHVLFAYLLRAPTARGRRLLDKLEGFRLYLNVAEKDDLNIAHPPDKTPELFERYLPFAVALGVAQQWAEQFTEVFARLAAEKGQAYHPHWYSGDFNAMRLDSFADDISSSFSSAISSAGSPPGSSSGGGGGGFSGGGGGGGGGGGW